MSAQACPFERRITFADTDAAGVAHFSKSAVIVEEAIHAFFQNSGIPILDSSTAWPIVSLQIDYSAPLKFGDLVQIALKPEKIGSSSITWNFMAAKKGTTSPALQGTLIQCHLNPATGSPSPIPEPIRILLKN